ncbi:MAG: hypothetical protein K2O65_13355 [Lachnospiraceae bacterium]|nr:hypothetical protein [Lachnospiraceae bacterium]
MKIKRVAVTISLVLISIIGLSGCGGEREFVEITELERNNAEQELVALPIPEREVYTSIAGDSDEDESSEATKLTALADDLEEAEKIADLYGIELDSYSYGVAVYVTDKDVQELISMGEENDYPTLAPNHKDKLHTVQ